MLAQGPPRIAGVQKQQSTWTTCNRITCPRLVQMHIPRLYLSSLGPGSLRVEAKNQLFKLVLPVILKYIKGFDVLALAGMVVRLEEHIL